MKLYKYTPHIEEFIRFNTLKLTPISQLNDPFELSLSTSYKNNIDSRIESHLSNKTGEKLKSKIKNLISQLFDEYGVLSLSRNISDLKMWGHYTNNYKGGVIEFEVPSLDSPVEEFLEESLEQYTFNSTILKPVNYSKSRKKFSSEKDIKDDLAELCFSKPKEWEHEQEIRIIASTKSSQYFKTDNTTYSHIKNQNRLSVSEKWADFVLLRNKKDTDWDIVFTREATELIKTNKLHPLLAIKPELVTALYLGMNFEEQKIQFDDLKKFSNLKNNIFKIRPDEEFYRFKNDHITIPS